MYTGTNMQRCVCWKIPSGGDISRCPLGGKNIKRGREKGGKSERKRKKVDIKRENGKY
jgi:hypothetical protein